LTDMFNRGSVK